MDEELTENMKETLLQIGFGTFSRRGGFFDEDGEKVDRRSINALVRRGLVEWGTRGASPMTLWVDLTEKGEEFFEELRRSEK